jgi:5-methyltetrahydropteroyltriglutamate--homocysteine methyltransferase
MTHIRSTHVGSLIRPPELLVYEAAMERGEPYDKRDYEAELARQVRDVVRRQRDAGIDVVSDGEFGKASWISYLYDRVSGIEQRPIPEGETRMVPSRDRQAFPGAYAQHDAEFRRALREAEVPAPTPTVWVCTGPISYDRTAVDRDIANLRDALGGLEAEGFLPVVAPASTYWLRNEHYASEEEFVFALADALAVEYRAIVDAGFLLQVDDAVLMHEMDSILAEGGSIEDYRKWAQLRVDALNHALQGIPEEKVRYHVCWGSWHGPHAFDPPLAEVVDLVLQVNAGFYAMEQANPRHEHEWRVWEDVTLPEGRKLIPGVVTHHTTIVEHPDLVADRLVRLAQVVGAENVLAGTDCGFAQTAFLQRVHPEVQWAKLQALAEGARRASERLAVTAQPRPGRGRTPPGV